MKLHQHVLLALLCTLSLSLYGQYDDCKVLKEEINENYEGKCKKGLAHGKGYAYGKDTYTGTFREGLPDGRGTYTFANEDYYIGEFMEGMKHGEGELHFAVEERDSVLSGLWEYDVYIGEKPPAPYVIRRVDGIDRFTVIKTGDGNRLNFRPMQNGTPNVGIEEYTIQKDTGNEITVVGGKGYANIEFPFVCRISYLSFNKLKSFKKRVIFDFIINEPGTWEVVVHN